MIFIIRLLTDFLTFCIELPVSYIWKALLKKKGIQHLIYISKLGSEDPFNNLVCFMETAIDIRIAVGEMGHRLMENEKVLTALEQAFEKNQASIEILHGPRVDPKTSTVFELAEQGKVSLFKTPVYYPHHFILLTDIEGNTTVVEEARHMETRWVEDSNGNVHEQIRAKARLYYVITNSKTRVEALQRMFRTRKTVSVRSLRHPYTRESPQEPFLSANVFKKLFGTIPLLLALKLFFQPLAVYRDSIVDIELNEAYWRWFRSQIKRGIRLPFWQSDSQLPTRGWHMIEARLMPETAAALHLIGSVQERTFTPTVGDFRRTHILEFGDRSIANLDIADAVFLELIDQKVDLISELKGKMGILDKDISAEVPRALDEWESWLRDH